MQKALRSILCALLALLLAVGCAVAEEAKEPVELIVFAAASMTETLTELKAAGRASILIPFPQAAENHQYYNALTMSKNGAAILIEDKDLTAERLLTEVKGLYEDRERLAGMEKAAAALNIPNATDLVVGNILDLIKDRPL